MSKVTIGMPLYNNARTVVRAIASLQQQTLSDFRLIASDDGSRDDTRALVAEIARADSRVQLVAQPTNLNYGNFRFVLDQADSPFFVFAAGDDWWEPDFLESAVRVLEANPGVVCAVPRVLMHPDNDEPYLSKATFPLSATPGKNVGLYLWDPGDNSRMYGVFRTEAARQSFPATDHYAYDWSFCALSLMFGTHVEVPRVLMHREVTPPGRYIEYARRDAKSSVDRVFPLLAMSKYLLARRVPLTRFGIWALLRLNLDAHLRYASRYHPSLARGYATLFRVTRAQHFSEVLSENT